MDCTATVNQTCGRKSHACAISDDGRASCWGPTFPVKWAMEPSVGPSLLQVLRRVMVHEFCHCFWWLADEVDAMDSGGTTIDTSDLDQNSDSDDRYQMVDPTDWFDVADASRMIYSGSPETQQIQDNLC